MKNGTLRFDSEEQMREHMRGSRRELFKAGKPIVPEKEAQASIFAFLRHHPLVAWCYRQNVGAGYLIDRKTFDRLVGDGHLKKTDARFIRFQFPGAHDITGQLTNGRRLEVEVKRVGGELRPEQIAFGQAVNNAKGLALFAYSIDDVARALG